MLSSFSGVLGRTAARCVILVGSPSLLLRCLVPRAQEVCVIVRTYHGHAHSALDRFVGSLMSQRETRWHACFVNTDIGEYNLAERLRSFEDPRLHMAQEHAHAAYTDYNAYELTDKAVSCCPPDARWILFTNGDNMYSPEGVLLAGLSLRASIF